MGVKCFHEVDGVCVCVCSHTAPPNLACPITWESDERDGGLNGSDFHSGRALTNMQSHLQFIIIIILTLHRHAGLSVAPDAKCCRRLFLGHEWIVAEECKNEKSHILDV